MQEPFRLVSHPPLSLLIAAPSGTEDSGSLRAVNNDDFSLELVLHLSVAGSSRICKP